MTKKIRLILDVVVQAILWIFLAVQIAQKPEDTMQHLAIFAGVITCWQMLHAWYVVRKYKDWQRNQHLGQLKKIIVYSLLTMIVGGLIVLVTIGALWPFLLFIVNTLYLLWAVGGSLLAIWYFWVSWKKLLHYYYKPRSFWDL
ncbi:MAG: hypothetical protein GY810_03260 [Aureispira sp.]|nr:hypothetical protein [Aureispira sp.]